MDCVINFLGNPLSCDVSRFSAMDTHQSIFQRLPLLGSCKGIVCQNHRLLVGHGPALPQNDAVKAPGSNFVLTTGS